MSRSGKKEVSRWEMLKMIVYNIHKRFTKTYKTMIIDSSLKKLYD